MNSHPKYTQPSFEGQCVQVPESTHNTINVNPTCIKWLLFTFQRHVDDEYINGLNDGRIYKDPIDHRYMPHKLCREAVVKLFHRLGGVNPWEMAPPNFFRIMHYNPEIPHACNHLEWTDLMPTHLRGVFNNLTDAQKIERADLFTRAWLPYIRPVIEAHTGRTSVNLDAEYRLEFNDFQVSMSGEELFEYYWSRLGRPPKLNETYLEYCDLSTSLD